MATCLKRPPATSKPSAASSSSNFAEFPSSSSLSSSLLDLVCPICQSLLQEPVTLPCAHNLCLRCLRGTIEYNSLTCPLCRQRVGSWLRLATRAQSLVNQKLWNFIKNRYSRGDAFRYEEGSNGNVFIPNKSISADGEIRKEYELQLKLQEEEMKRQREKERIASEACIRKLEEEEKQRKMLQLAQDQLFARTLEKQEIENAKERRIRSTRIKLNNETKSKTSKPLSKTKISADKKQNMVLISKMKSEKYTSSNSKYNSISAQKESPEIIASPKPVPIHNAVTKVVTHQRSKQLNNSTSTNQDEFIGSSSKIYGQQSEEELHVPSDVLSNKKKKLDVEVCLTTVNVEDEERIGSAESTGSHDSMNQEFHHFKPIKALPRTTFKTADGKQSEPKLIKVPPIKQVCNDVPKSPDHKSWKKIFGCASSAFTRIVKRQVLFKDSQNQQQQETKKTEECKMEQSLLIFQKSEIDSNTDSSSVMSFDSNKNYTKNPGNKAVNGTKLNTNGQPAEKIKQTNKRGKVRNGLIASAFKKKESYKKKEIEVVHIDDDDEDENIDIHVMDGPNLQRTPDPLGPSPNKLDSSQSRLSSYLFEFEPIENIAERIKRRKAVGTNNVQSALDMVKPVNQTTKVKSKKPSAKGRKPKAKKQEVSSFKLTKTKTKTVVTETTVTSQIKRLARAKKSSKRPRYTEDSESEEEDFMVKQKNPKRVLDLVNNIEQKPVEQSIKALELEKPDIKLFSPSPRKRPRKNAHPSKKQKPTVFASSFEPSINFEDESFLKEQERFEQVAEQERKDRELAEQLQARFDAMQRVAGRTRRGTARLPELSSSPSITVIEQPKRPPQKRPTVK